MNWGRIKTILIILFLFTDAFLAFSIFTAKKEETKISPEVIDAAIQVLGEHSISLDRSVIPSKIPQAMILQADNVISDYEEFAKSVLGDSFLSDDYGSFYTENAKLTISGDTFFFKSLEDLAVSENYTLSDAQKSAFSYLKEIGFDVLDAKVVSASLDKGICNMTIQGFAENMPLYSSEVNISLSKGGILSLSGSWFNQKDNTGEDSNLKSITGILVDFASSYNDGACKIKSIELGYSVFDSATYHKSASLIPVTKITLNDGSEYFMDSRSAQ